MDADKKILEMVCRGLANLERLPLCLKDRLKTLVSLFKNPQIAVSRCAAVRFIASLGDDFWNLPTI